MGYLILVFCRNGPYRAIEQLIGDTEWLPWGYRRSQIEDTLNRSTSLRGRHFQLWAVDDSREPKRADWVADGVIDFVVPTAEYVAMTVRRDAGGAAAADPAAVLRGVRAGFLMFDPNSPAVKRDRTEGKPGTASDGSAVRSTVASLSLG